MPNALYFGDNLEVLRKHIPDESVDLVYLDPPFNSRRDYNVLFQETNGTDSSAQIRAFSDYWKWGEEAEKNFQEVLDKGNTRLIEMMGSFRSFLKTSDMMAYLAMMAPRILEIHRVLKPTGSLYLHCDTTASHYIKMLLDAVFGVMNFRNEIIWKRFNFHADAKRFGRIADRILYYSKNNIFVFNQLKVPFSDHYITSKFYHIDTNGRRYCLDNLNPPGGRGPVYEFHGVTKPWRFSKEKMLQLEAEGRIYTGSKIPRLKRFLDELPGQAVHELWTDIPAINSQAKERLGYQTQKPLALLERIIMASSNNGNLVLDPFCGCGTTIIAAQKLKRRWIGIDITHLAINLMKWRIQDSFGGSVSYTIHGLPKDIQGAIALFKQDPFEFQHWALMLVNARSVNGPKKKGSDRGIDGIGFFVDDPSEKTKKIIVQVKGGENITVKDIRDLVGVIDREKAQMGLFLTIHPPTGPMKKEAAQAGFYRSEYWNTDYPRVQIALIGDLLEGHMPKIPPNVKLPHKRAERIKQENEQQQLL